MNDKKFTPSEQDSFHEKLGELQKELDVLIGKTSGQIVDTVNDTVGEVLDDKKSPNAFERMKKKLSDIFDNFTWGRKGEEEEKISENIQEQHHLDSDEYIPHDMEFGESLGKVPRFAEIQPVLNGYYISGRKAYFDQSTNLWSKKKKLSNFQNTVDISKQSHIYSGKIPGGLVSIPLQNGCLPDITSLVYSGGYKPKIKVDQNNCLYLQSKESQYISFTFYRDQQIDTLAPIDEELENIAFIKLSNDTEAFIDQVQSDQMTTEEKAKAIAAYIQSSKKYSIKYQGTLRNVSNSKDYLKNIDKAPAIECYSSATLYAGISRKLGIFTRVVVGNFSTENSEGKSLLGSNNGHAWNEYWDETKSEWIRIDATPNIKDGNDNNEQGNSNDESEGDTDDQEQGGETGSEESGNQGEGKGEGETSEQGSDTSDGSKSEQGKAENSEINQDSSPSEALQDIIEQAKKDSLSKQAQDLKETISQLENTDSKEEIREILDNSALDEFAKDMIEEVGNKEMMRQEREELSQMNNEDDIEKWERESLLDDAYKNLLRQYAKIIRDKIEKEKKQLKSEMERMGFSNSELRLYKQYIELEKEIEGEVRSQIRALEKILPPKFRVEQDRNNHYRSGNQLGNTGKLIEHVLTNDPAVFRRSRNVQESSKINMFETIIIDRSVSMGDFKSKKSPLRASVKAAIIRAKVLEHFKVEFSIMFFDDDIEEIMEFGETFTDKRRNTVPSRLMRAVNKNGGTNIGQPLAYTLEKMNQYSRKTGSKSYGSISFIGDGEPTGGLRGKDLKKLISTIKSRGYGLTAYYIGGSSQNKGELEGYFGNEESGGTILVPNVTELTSKLISTYNNHLRGIIRRYTQ